MKITMFRLIITVGLLAMNAGSAFAHGESKPGPHGGTIRMPGAYHFEVVPVGAHQFKIYLLDINFRMPTVKKSSVQASWSDTAGEETNLVCRPEADYFLCSAKSPTTFEKGYLMLSTVRDGLKGAAMTLDLPLGNERHDRD